jgi:hypothetical protein
MKNVCPSLNIGVRTQEVNGSVNLGSNGTPWEINGGGTSAPMTVTGIGPNVYGGGGGGVGVASSTAGWVPPRTPVDDFFKIQYTAVEARCAITRKMIPVGSPVMLLGGMVISQEAFENWLEEHLAGMIGRHEDVHTDNGDDYE